MAAPRVTHNPALAPRPRSACSWDILLGLLLSLSLFSLGISLVGNYKQVGQTFFWFNRALISDPWEIVSAAARFDPSTLLHPLQTLLNPSKIMSSTTRTAKELPVSAFPPLAALGYGFTDGSDGRPQRLVQLDNDLPFEFTTQEAYDAVGVAVQEYIEHLMVSAYGLVKVDVRDDGKGREDYKRLTRSQTASAPIYLSPDWASSTAPMLVLVHGSGAVRAGMWSRALCINENLEVGSVLPYIADAQKKGWTVAVLNTNWNRDAHDLPIPGSENPREHLKTVWRTLLSRAATESILWVGHSYGGQATHHLMIESSLGPEVRARVKGVAYTDSVHKVVFHDAPQEARKWLQDNGQNWTSSSAPLGGLMYSLKEGVMWVSAGTTQHERTSASARVSVISWLENRLAHYRGLEQINKH